MAGFAVLMTILTYGLLGVIAAGIVSVCLYSCTKRRVRKDEHRRNNVALLSAAAPFVGLLWLAVALLIHVQISNKLANQDCGFSPDPYVTLPSGYVLGSTNTYDGYFKAPGFETGVPVAGPGYVRSIIDLQLSHGYFIGTQFDFKASRIRAFVFDTRTRAFQISGGGESSTWEAAVTRARDDATSYWKLYEQYRRHWPNYILLALIIGGEGAICVWLWKLLATEFKARPELGQGR